MNCTKSLSIEVNDNPGTPTEWFKMDEIGPGSRVGSIAGTILQDLGNPTPSAAGLISLAADSSATGSVLFVNPGVAVLAYPGAGFDAFGWVQPVSFTTGVGDSTIVCGWFNFTTSSFKFGVVCEPWLGSHAGGPVSPPCIRFNVNGDGPNEDILIPYTFVSGTWFFWRVFYDTALGRFGVQVDNGAITYSAVQAFTAFLSGGWAVSNTGSGVASGFLVDESGIFFPGPLSASQASAIYNSGAGRTFP